MPAESEDQRRAAGAALAAKRGERPVSSLKGASKGMYESMTEEELRDFARKPQTTREASGVDRERGAKKAKGSTKHRSKGQGRPRTTRSVVGIPSASAKSRPQAKRRRRGSA